MEKKLKKIRENIFIELKGGIKNETNKRRT